MALTERRDSGVIERRDRGRGMNSGITRTSARSPGSRRAMPRQRSLSTTMQWSRRRKKRTRLARTGPSAPMSSGNRSL